MKITFAEYLEFVNADMNPNIPLERRVVGASLGLFGSVGKLAEMYAQETLYGRVLTGNKILHVCEQALRSVAILFCIANEGNTISEESFCVHIGWDIKPEGGGFTAQNLAVAAHIANRNMQDVIASGLLQRSSFYPMFNAIGKIAAESQATLSDVAATATTPRTSDWIGEGSRGNDHPHQGEAIRGWDWVGGGPRGND